MANRHQRNRVAQSSSYREHAIHSDPEDPLEADLSAVNWEEELGEDWEQEMELMAAMETASAKDAPMTSTRRKTRAQPSTQEEPRLLQAKPKARVPKAMGYPPEEEVPPPLAKVSTKSTKKAEQLAATTGERADFPVLGMTKSWDPPMNTSWVLHQRLITHKWKVMVWLLRIRQACMNSRVPWKRNPRWLANLFATEMAAIWGHLGSCVKSLRGPKGPVMFR